MIKPYDDKEYVGHLIKLKTMLPFSNHACVTSAPYYNVSTALLQNKVTPLQYC